MNPSTVNADFSQRVVVVPPGPHQWVPSPLPGVERHMLDRIGAEVARATSVVRYAAGSRFDRHVHGGGEEFIILEGVFSDEHGDYPAGTYVRNPPGTAHTPYSFDGCTMFVKLWQFAPDDLLPVRIDTRRAEWVPGDVPGLTLLPLHEHNGISTSLLRWAPHTRFGAHSHPGGEEVLVLEGVLHDDQGDYPAGTWIRSPSGSRHEPFTATEGALIYVKVGHLGTDPAPPPGTMTKAS